MVVVDFLLFFDVLNFFFDVFDFLVVDIDFLLDFVDAPVVDFVIFNIFEILPDITAENDAGLFEQVEFICCG